jgi:KUP system potassium uptake protein
MSTHTGGAPTSTRDKQRLAGLCVTALGVVYGDIGTSPLYALRECFHGAHAIEPSAGNVLGILSLVFWTLIIVVSLKYLIYVLRADNRGEGGILALMALVRGQVRSRHRQAIFVALGLFGAALLYGDGAITPAISVLSAVEGIDIATPIFHSYTVPATILVLVGLFVLQRRGTTQVGNIFGPIMAAWFVTLAVLGIGGIERHPAVLAAINPLHAVRFFLHHGGHGFLVLGAVFLVATGGEALYADMGHFGKRPIQIDWFSLVAPALVLNYFGQGALLITNPGASVNPFYRLAPEWLLIPLVVLSTIATVIASQAVISGAFSLTGQAIQLGYLPRVSIIHTSGSEIGQIYIPLVNGVLMLATIGLVLGFGSSTNLAAAYGLAVSLTMVITTLLAFVVARLVWKWPLWVALLVTAGFLVADLAFFGANVVKITEGGWFPLLAGGLVYLLMANWHWGRATLEATLRKSKPVPLASLVSDLKPQQPPRVEGTAVYLSRDVDSAPWALLHNIRHTKVLHKTVVLLTIVTEEVPYVESTDSIEVNELGKGFFFARARYGFMQSPSIPEIVPILRTKGLPLLSNETTFFLARASVVARDPRLRAWRKRVFAFLQRNALRPTEFLEIPPNQVVELGFEIAL